VHLPLIKSRVLFIFVDSSSFQPYAVQCGRKPPNRYTKAAKTMTIGAFLEGGAGKLGLMPFSGGEQRPQFQSTRPIARAVAANAARF
jgi:hypothetical protein